MRIEAHLTDPVTGVCNRWGQERKAATTNPTRAPANPEEPALAWGKARGLLTDSNAAETLTRAELVRVLYKLKGE
ncbi:hypothetical protein [Dysosmobacter sp.]|uniref:hypothetical protein n=1 Tax=Dysosmobacter sp. TaxID=2591382 RepID=UPI0026728128|nr:hypothetical protein [Dysosmobacter sp.]MCI7281942.1 hypothetical protein [Dysosmobacter sp.]